MRFLVTGGAGFIGTNFILLASRKGHSILALDNLSRKGSEENLKNLVTKRGVVFKKLDIRNVLPLNLGNFDAIVHLAATCSTSLSFKNPYADFIDNALGTINVLEFARKNGKIPVIYASTCKVYTTELNTWKVKSTKTRYKFDSILGVDENGPTDAKSSFSRAPYGCSKYTGDLYCQEYFKSFGVPTVVNRLSTVFGKYQRGSPESGYAYWFIKAKKENLPIEVFGTGKQVRDLVWGEDIAKLFLQEIENIDKHSGQIYNIGGGIKNSLSLIELISYLNSKGGSPLKVSFKPERKADLKVYISNLNKITKNSSWKPQTDVFDGIDQLLKEKDL